MMTRIYKDVPVPSRRLPAEWENYDGVMMSWPHSGTDWEYMLDEVQSTVVEIIRTLVSEGLTVVVVAPDVDEPKHALASLPQDKLLFFTCDTNDTWTRDYGTITCETVDHRPLFLDFKFNGWGLKFASDKDNLVTSGMYGAKLLRGDYENHLGFVLEGGSIESDGQGTIMTTSECLLSPNRNGDMSREEIDQCLKGFFGANRVLWLDYGYLAGDDTDSHIDTLARFVWDDIIVYVKCQDKDDEHYQQLELMERQLKEFRTAAGQPYHLVGLPMPSPIYDEDGNRLPATYANFLITPFSVLLPVYGQPNNDFLAEQMIRAVFPGRKVHKINCRSLIKQHGSLHCMTMQLPYFNII